MVYISSLVYFTMQEADGDAMRYLSQMGILTCSSFTEQAKQATPTNLLSFSTRRRNLHPQSWSRL
jgi:hypothetical protein